MRISIGLGVFCLVVITVSAAPVTDPDSPAQESDDIEQQLVRDDHSTLKHKDEDADDNSYSSENMDDESSPVESIEDVPDDVIPEGQRESYSEDDLYDITVGDVIRDVLLTLSEHPEIVKELDLERKKDKIATRLAEDAMDSVGADLSDFQGPAEQLKNEPKRVQKKDGKSGMVRPEGHVEGNHGNTVERNDAESNGFMSAKRTNEVLDETFSPEVESSESLDRFAEFKEFMKSAKNVNKYRKLYGGDSQDESESYDYRRHFADNSPSEDSSSMKDVRGKYRLPFLNPFSMFKNMKGSSSSDSSSWSTESENSSSRDDTGSDVTETESDSTQEDSSSESSQSSEEQLSWLQHQMEANKKKSHSQKNM